MKYFIQVIIMILVAQNLLSCFQSEEGDYSPPEIKKITPAGTISATDSVEVVFNEVVDTGTFNLELNSGNFEWKFLDSRKILLYGTEETLGKRHFAFGQNIESLIRNLKDVKGNKAVDIPLDLEFYPWYDAEVFDRAYNQGDSLMLSEKTDSWRSGLPLDSLLISEGAIEGKWNLREGDHTDYKLLFLEPQDILKLKLTTDPQVNFKVSLVGPFAIKNFEQYIEVLEEDLKNIPELKVFEKKTGTSGKVEAEIQIEFEKHARLIVDTANNISSSAPGIYIIRIEPDLLEQYGYYRLETQLQKFL